MTLCPEMNFDDVTKTIDHISSISKDYEAAHIIEDELYRSVLEHIASGCCDNPQSWAKEALKTQYVRFDRWFSK